MNRPQRPIVYAVRDFPTGCGTHSEVSRFHFPENTTFNNPRTSVKNLSNGTSSLRNPYRMTDLVAGALKPYGTSSLRQESVIRNPNRMIDHVASAPKPNGGSSRNPNWGTDRVAGTSSQRREPEIRSTSDSDPTSREKVLDVLRLFKQVYLKLDRDKAARRGDDSFDSTSRIDLKTQAVIEEMGKQVNREPRIGSVPGIKIGDEFQYKSELRIVGLHFKTMSGIDYMKVGEVKFATCIASSDSYDYNDRFESDVLVYTGEGGNVINKEREIEDQKLVNGNLALANSMREKKEVRVVRGEERLDRKGKRYIYDGLYLVDEYWVEKGFRGKNVFKFKLCRIPGQPPLTLKKQY